MEETLPQAILYYKFAPSLNHSFMNKAMKYVPSEALKAK